MPAVMREPRFLMRTYYLDGLRIIVFAVLLFSRVYCSALVTGNVRTEQAAACETQDLVIKCPAKTSLYIQFANYGRLRSSNDRPCHNIVQTGARSNVSIFHTAYDINEESTDCMASNSREIVAQLCQDKRSCRIPVNAETFKQDPCPRTWKYLDVAYKCKPSVFHNHVVCEGEEMTLECELPTHRLAIHSVMFGRDRSGGNPVCSGSAMTKRREPSSQETECASSFASEIAMRKCQNERVCTLVADESTFGNQCPSGTKKYLTISYACVPQRILIAPLLRNKEAATRFEEKPDDYLHVDHDEDNALQISPVPQRSIDMQAIQPDYAQGSPRGGHEYFPGKKFLEEVTTDPSNGRCNCTKQFAVLMDWIVAVQKIKQNKEACILYACLSAGIGLLLLTLFVLIHLLIKRRLRRKPGTTTVIAQSSARALQSKTKEQRIPLYNTHFPDESDETDQMPVDLTRFTPRNTLPRAATLQVDGRKPNESRSLHRMSTTDGSFYS